MPENDFLDFLPLNERKTLLKQGKKESNGIQLDESSLSHLSATEKNNLQNETMPENGFQDFLPLKKRKTFLKHGKEIKKTKIKETSNNVPNRKQSSNTGKLLAEPSLKTGIENALSITNKSGFTSSNLKGNEENVINNNENNSKGKKPLPFDLNFPSLDLTEKDETKLEAILGEPKAGNSKTMNETEKETPKQKAVAEAKKVVKVKEEKEVPDKEPSILSQQLQNISIKEEEATLSEEKQQLATAQQSQKTTKALVVDDANLTPSEQASNLNDQESVVRSVPMSEKSDTNLVRMDTTELEKNKESSVQQMETCAKLSESEKNEGNSKHIEPKLSDQNKPDLRDLLESKRGNPSHRVPSSNSDYIPQQRNQRRHETAPSTRSQRNLSTSRHYDQRHLSPDRERAAARYHSRRRPSQQYSIAGHRYRRESSQSDRHQRYARPTFSKDQNHRRYSLADRQQHESLSSSNRRKPNISTTINQRADQHSSQPRISDHQYSMAKASQKTEIYTKEPTTKSQSQGQQKGKKHFVEFVTKSSEMNLYDRLEPSSSNQSQNHQPYYQPVQSNDALHDGQQIGTPILPMSSHAQQPLQPQQHALEAVYLLQQPSSYSPPMHLYQQPNAMHSNYFYQQGTSNQYQSREPAQNNVIVIQPGLNIQNQMVKQKNPIEKPNDNKNNLDDVVLTFFVAITAINHPTTVDDFPLLWKLNMEANANEVVELINKQKQSANDDTAESMIEQMRLAHNLMGKCVTIFDEIEREIFEFEHKFPQNLSSEAKTTAKELKFIFLFIRLFRKTQMLLTARVYDTKNMHGALVNWLHLLDVKIGTILMELAHSAWPHFLNASNWLISLTGLENIIALVDLAIYLILPNAMLKTFTNLAKPTTIRNLFGLINKDQFLAQFNEMWTNEWTEKIDDHLIKTKTGKNISSFAIINLGNIFNEQLMKLQKSNSGIIWHGRNQLKQEYNRQLHYHIFVHLRLLLNKPDFVTISFPKLHQEKSNGIAFLDECIEILKP